MNQCYDYDRMAATAMVAVQPTLGIHSRVAVVVVVDGQ